MADQGADEPLGAAQRVGATEAMAGGMALLASFLDGVGSMRGDARAHADTARRALVPLSPILVTDHDASAECRSCPLCRLLAMARLVAPEMVDGLGDALDAVMEALRDELEGRARDQEAT